jgi:tripartite-type tricarboxylate transporter receptor subunit TctC
MKILLAGLALTCGAAVAQEYPTRPVRLIVGLVPGGNPDTYARLAGRFLAERLGQQFIVENRPGGGSNVAADIVAKSAPDGHTVFVGASNVVTLNPHIYRTMPFEPFKDLVPVQVGIATTMWLVAHPSVNARTVKELVALAKAAPQPMPYASSGHGSIHHLTMEAFKTQGGVDLLHVPFKGAAQSVPALISGDVLVGFVGYPSLAPAIKGNRLRVIAFSMDRRSRLTPDIPTVAESGMPGFNMAGTVGEFVAAGTPQAIVNRLNDGFNAAIRAPDVLEKLGVAGLETIGGTQQEYIRMLREEYERLGPIARQLGLKAD